LQFMRFLLSFPDAATLATIYISLSADAFP
jgi:hypothetical protein